MIYFFVTSNNINCWFMKNIYLFPFIFFSLFVQAQKDYPTPPSSTNRLFYIQHNESKNTFVYDAVFSTKEHLDEQDPVNIYRILYEASGEKKPLTAIQKKLAYGLKIKKKEKNVFLLTLVSYPSQQLILKLNAKKHPIVLTTVNGKEMTLKRVFLKKKSGTGGLSVKLDYILFHGIDKNGNSIQEKIVL